MIHYTNVQIKNESMNELPTYQTVGSSGMDLMAHINEPIVIPPKKWDIIPTGIKVALPSGIEAQIQPRSGLPAKKGVTVLNSPGTIDSDYRGEIKVMLMNNSNNDFEIENGDRIAQMILSEYIKAKWKQVVKLPPTDRNEKGFGSTGVKRESTITSIAENETVENIKNVNTMKYGKKV